MPHMSQRDYVYVENRLYDAGSATEAARRLRETGHKELADRVIAAAAVYMDELRAVRMELRTVHYGHITHD